jgi:hypothetical protein
MRYVLCLAGVFLLVTGCGPSDPRSRSFEVTGMVTFDGQPVPDGSITLLSGDPSLADDAGSIVNGEYRFLASAGQKKVQIRASRDVIKSTKPHDPKYEEYIPAQFNDRTKLTMEVIPG